MVSFVTFSGVQTLPRAQTENVTKSNGKATDLETICGHYKTVSLFIADEGADVTAAGRV